MARRASARLGVHKHVVPVIFSLTFVYLMKVNDVEPTKPPVPKPDPNCELDNYSNGMIMQGYSQDGEKCVAVFDIPHTWQNGEHYCQSLDGTGHLVSVHSQAELSFVLSIVGMVGHTPGDIRKIWIGLNEKTASSQWRWADGSLLDFTNWSGNQPNNNNGQKLCGEMSESTGLMAAQACDQQRHIVCSWSADGKPIVPIPVPDLEGNGGCPSGWYRYRKRCFQYVGLENESPNRLSWDDANNDCIKKGGYLASIYDEYYNCK